MNCLNHRFAWLLLFVFGFVSCSSLNAQLIVDAGDIQLLENTAGQVVSFSATGPDSVQGLNFNVQIADGGPGLAGGSIAGPTITAIDITGLGTIFENNNTGQGGGLIVPQIAGVTITTNTGRVAGEGVLAFVTFDTTGFFASDSNNPFDIILTGPQSLNGNTDFAGSLDTDGIAVPFSVTNGTLTLVSAVPEPSSAILLGLVGICVGLRRRR